MAKKGISVRQLAHELGLTSRELMDRCRAENITAQNSITKLPPATERRIRAWFDEDTPGETNAAATQ